MISKATFISNIGASLLSQGVAYGLSFLMTLVVPKYISVSEFGYWQLFSLYASYSALFLFGSNDGVLIRLGGQEYKDLNYPVLAGQLKLVCVSQIVIAACLVLYAGFAIAEDSSRQFVYISFALYIPVFNTFTYLSYIFQAVNMTRIYSTATIIWKVTFVLYVALGFIVLSMRDCSSLMVAYICCAVFGLVYILWKGREMIFASCSRIWTRSLKELRRDIFVGMKLSIAYYCGSLVLGIARMIVDARWGISNFSYFSLGVSMLQIVLAFVASISIVLFPALRTVERAKYSGVYWKGRALVSAAMPCTYFLLPALAYFIHWYLPQYESSVAFFGLLLPVCVCDIKNNMLNMTYLKALREENSILLINAITLGVAVGAFLLFGSTIEMIAVIAVICILVRGLAAEFRVSHLLSVNTLSFAVVETLATLAYLLSMFSSNNLIAMLIVVAWLITALFMLALWKFRKRRL